jgi:signal transduction histidine kinase/ligand-binding sensor domain-containing protein
MWIFSHTRHCSQRHREASRHRGLRFIACACTAFALAAGPARALDPDRRPDQYLLSDWNTSHGIPYTAIRALHHSRDGYLWVVTRGGLARFDGQDFVAFTHANTPELVDDEVYALADGADGTMWAATARGVLWYRGGRWSRPPELDRLRDESVRWVESDGDSMLLGTPKGVFRFEAGRLSEVKLPEPVTLTGFRTICRAGESDWLIVAQTSWHVRGNQARRIDDASGVPIDEVYSAAADPEGFWWIAAEAGLYQLRDGRTTHMRTLAGRTIPSARFLLFDRDRNLWISTRGEMLRLAGGRIHVVERPGVDTIANFLCLHEDSEGNLWGGNDRGLVRFSDAKVINISYADGLPARSVVSVLSSRDGTLWAGIWGGGLTRMSAAGAIERVYAVGDGLATDTVWNLAEGPDGTLWLGYYNQGIGRFRDGQFTNLPGLPLMKPRLRDFKVTPDGKPWISTWAGGLVTVDDDRIQPVPVPGVQVSQALLVDRRGRLWLSWTGGFGRFDTTTHQLVERYDGGPESQHEAIAMLEDPAGDIWILREQMTIQRMRAGRVQTVVAPAWVGRLTYSAVIHQGEMWVNFRNGILRASLDSLDKAFESGSPLEFEFFRESDGMRSVAPNVFTGQGATVTRDGRLHFATSSGVAIIDPSHIRRVTKPPNVLIERIVVDKVAHIPGQPATFAPGRGEVQIKFTALGLTAATLNRFKYRLLPLENDWIDAGRERSAYYGGLSPGDYRFEVVAANADGVWNTQGAVCTFRLTPHFYQTWWFYAVVTLALPLGIWGYVRRHDAALRQEKRRLEEGIAVRTLELHESNRKLTLQFLETARKAAALQQSEERIRSLNEELESRVAARTDELRAANRELESFTYSVSHDLRAPLRGIDGWSLAILEDHGARLAPEALAHLQRVRAETQRLGNLIDDLLKLSRTTRAELKPTPLDLSALARHTADRVAAARSESRVAFTCQPGLRVRGDASLIEAALYNLFDNAWKFSSRATQPRVEFGLTDTDRGPAFFVRDNGAGFDMRHARQLFGVFQRLHTQDEFPGTGVGLATVQRIFQRHGGDIWAESQPGRGATFYFTIAT